MKNIVDSINGKYTIEEMEEALEGIKIPELGITDNLTVMKMMDKCIDPHKVMADIIMGKIKI